VYRNRSCSVRAALASQPEIAVVFATHNRPGWSQRMLDSLREQTLPRDAFEVIVVDDGSTDDTPAVLERERQRADLELRVIHRRRSEGPAAARNDGWRAARAPIVAFTDDDCVAQPQWLEAGLRACREHRGAIVQGRTDPEPEEFRHFGPFSYTLQVKEKGPWYETCNMFYPRDLLERLGGFDAASFTGPGGEDTDLAWRAIGCGTETAFAEDALVYHAVHHLGPIKKLKLATRWSETMLCFARYPWLRGELTRGLFWKENHYMLARAAVALILPRRLWPVRAWLAAPYIAFLTNRRSVFLLAPYLILHDLVEIGAVARGAVRYRTLVL
jgi:glycosyltransferase involved in cell wall biosynthesis